MDHTVLGSITVTKGFSTPAPFTFWVEQLLVVGCCPVHCRMSSGISGLYLLMPVAQYPAPNCDNQICLQMLPSVSWGAKLSPVEKLFILNWTMGFWDQFILRDLLNNSHTKNGIKDIIYCITLYSLFSITRAIGEICFRL